MLPMYDLQHSLDSFSIDRNKRFHPFGLRVSPEDKNSDFAFMFNAVKKGALKIHNIDYHPKTLIADDAGAITLGFSSIHRLEKVTVFS